MKKVYYKGALAALFMSISVALFSQNVAINSSGNKGNAAAILDLSDASNSSLGFLLPNVDIGNVNSASPVSSPPAGLIVWNTNSPVVTTGGFGAGFYYWSGTSWIFMQNSGTLAATNGLSLNGSAFELGGTFTAATNITQAGFALDISGGTIGLNDGTSAAAVNIANGTTGGNAISIGNTHGTTSIAENVGTGNFTLNGTGASTYTIGSSATSGTITVGGAGQTGAITLGKSTQNNTINIGNAATANGNTQTINIGAGGGAGTGNVNIGGGAYNATNSGTTTIESGTGGIVLQVKSATIATPVTTSATAGTETVVLQLAVPANAVTTAGQTFRIKLYGVENVAAGKLNFAVRVGPNGNTNDNLAWSTNAASAAQAVGDWAGCDVMVTLQSSTAVQAAGVAWAIAALLEQNVAAPATTAIASSATWYIDVDVTCSKASGWTAETGAIELVH